jgi:7-keto-8-aminopelargonate synthetase-like enzyme/predicted N-acyltransferase
MEISQFLDTLTQIHGEARSRGVYFRDSEDTTLRGRDVRIGDRSLVSFSSCSYLGLENHPALVEGVIEATRAFGTQFSSSRGYISAPLYTELESLLSQMFGGHALVTSSTTLGHQSVLTALLTERDGIVMDHQVHHSVQMAARLAQAGGAKVSIVRHNELERAADEVERLTRSCDNVWFACDGVFSMYGDLAPLKLLRHLLSISDKVKLYVDDAHGMSWAGRHGVGSFLSRMPFHDRMILATSLNKAFSAAGGVMVFPTAEMRKRVMDCGGPMVFSGPVQPPMLGAAVASAKLHLSDEIYPYQEALAERTRMVNRRMGELNLPLLVENEAPIFFVRMGLPRVAFRVVQRLMDEGYFINASVYPTVPMKRAGVRFAVTAAHRMEDIEGALTAMARIVPEVLEEEALSTGMLDEMFASAVPEEALRSEQYSGVQLADVMSIARPTRSSVPAGLDADPRSLTVEHYHSIDELDTAEWDALLGGIGACSAEAQRVAEQTFSGQSREEYNWDFHYVIVRTADGTPVAATFFSAALSKDDMLMRDEVSQAVEAKRATDPYFLTSRIVTMGSGFSEGDHLYLDRQGPWRAALVRLLEIATEVYDQQTANMLLLRDLSAEDPEMDAFLRDQGFVKIPMFTSYYLDIDWKSQDEYLAGLSRRKRRHLREIIDRSQHYSVKVFSPETGESLDDADLAHLYRLYRNVADRKRKLNVFPLPASLMPRLQSSDAWELVAVYLSEAGGGPADGKPVAFYAAHRHGEDYAPFLCGLDYRFVFEHGAYRGMIFEMIQRAQAAGFRHIHMGMDADQEKQRFGCRPMENCVYLQARDHFNGELLREVVAEVGLEQPMRKAG